MFRNQLKVKLAENSILQACGKGSLRTIVYNVTEKVNLILNAVLYVPNIQNNLLSSLSLTAKCANMQFKGQDCDLVIGSKVYNTGCKHGKLYKLNSDPVYTSFFLLTHLSLDLLITVQIL